MKKALSEVTDMFQHDEADDNEEEVIATNNRLTVDEGAIAGITSTFLETTDADNTPSELIYNLTSPLANGQLELTSAPGASQCKQDAVSGRSGCHGYSSDSTFKKFVQTRAYQTTRRHGTGRSGGTRRAIRHNTHQA